MEGNRIAADEFAAVVRQLYRMFKTGTIHLMNNEAVTQSIGATIKAVSRLADQGLDEISILFLNDTVFVNGTLLKAGREIYETALELGLLLRRAGANEMSVSTSATIEELSEVVAFASHRMRAEVRQEEVVERLPRFSEGASLRMVDPELLEDVQAGSMTARDRLGRTYASTLVVMRFLYDGLKEGRYAVSRQLKRLTQQLVLLAEEEPQAFLGITRMRNVQDDEAGRALNSAILAILAARELTTDVRTVSRVALSALMADVGRPRAAGMGKSGGRSIAVIPMLSDEQRRTLPRDTVIAIAAVGRLHNESLHRTVVGYEAQWLANKPVLGELYEGEYLPCLESTLVYMVRRFNELITYDVYTQRRMAPDDAMRVLRQTASDETERRCADLLFQGLGLVPRGSVVELASGHVGVVLGNSDKPGLYGLPSLHIFADENGEAVNGILVDLAKPSRDVLRYGGIRRIREDLESPSDLPQVEYATPPKARPISKPSARKRVLPDSIRRRVANDSDFELDDDIVVEMIDEFDSPREELSDDIELVPFVPSEDAARAFESTSASDPVGTLQLDSGDFEQVPPPLPPAIRPDSAPAETTRPAPRTSSAPLPLAISEPRDVTPVEIPSLPPAAHPEQPPQVIEEDSKRASSCTPAASPAVTTGALPAVQDFGTIEDSDAGEELDSMLESYFGSPPKRTHDDGTQPQGVRAVEHSLPNLALMGTAELAPTGPLPKQAVDATGDLSEPVAHNLLRSYFPETGAPKRAELSQAHIPRAASSGPRRVAPRTSDTLVENVPNPHQILSSHFPDTDAQPSIEAQLAELIAGGPTNSPRESQTLGSRFEAPNFDSVLPSDSADAVLSDTNDLPELDGLNPSARATAIERPLTPPQAAALKPPRTSTPARTTPFRRPSEPAPVVALGAAADAPDEAALESLLSSYLLAKPSAQPDAGAKADTDDLLAAYLSGESAPPRRAILRRKPKLGAVVERTSGMSETGEARRVRASTASPVVVGGAPAPQVRQAKPGVAASIGSSPTPPRPEPSRRRAPIQQINQVDRESADVGFEAPRDFAGSETDDFFDSIRHPAVSLAGELGNDDLTPPPQDTADVAEPSHTMFGSPASLELDDSTNTVPDAAPKRGQGEATRQVSGEAADRLLFNVETPSALPAVADERPATDLATTPLPSQAAPSAADLAATPLPAPAESLAPPVASAPPVRSSQGPNLGPDTMEVDDAHATEVLRDFLRERSVPSSSGGKPKETSARPGQSTPRTERSVATPPAQTTVEMGAAAADALLGAYTRSHGTMPETAETEPANPTAPDTTREVGSHQAADLLSRYMKPDK